jgi:hypothetical protein
MQNGWPNELDIPCAEPEAWSNTVPQFGVKVLFLHAVSETNGNGKHHYIHKTAV